MGSAEWLEVLSNRKTENRKGNISPALILDISP